MTIATMIAIEYRPGEYRAAAINDVGAPIEFRVERTHTRSMVGGVFLGRVRAVRSEIGAAFVDIGLSDDAFLNIRTPKTGGTVAQDSLGTEIKEGAAILVQVNRDATADKGARLTLHISDAVIGANSVAGASCPSCIIDPPALPTRIIRDWCTPETARIVVDDTRTMSLVQAQLAKFPIDQHPDIEFSRNMTAFAFVGIDEVFEDQLSPVVRLPGGGSIIIEHTSAMTTIDVNVGQGEEGEAARLALKTNIEAAGAIADALRLHGIGGLIAVDFLKMKSKADNEKTVKVLRDALANDPVNPQTTGMSGFGIVEIARRREFASLSGVFLHNESTPTPTTLALDALHEVRKRRGTSATITASLDVIAELKGPIKSAKTELEAELGFVIQLETRPDTASNGYSVI